MDMRIRHRLYRPQRLIMLTTITIVAATAVTHWNGVQAASGSRRLYLPFVAVAARDGAQDRAREVEMLRLINENRRAHQLPPLTEVSSLTQAARRHARDMADHDLTSHIGTDGTNGGERIRQAGNAWTRWGESIGWEFRAARDMVNWWMNSSTHRAVILSPDMTDLGLGYAFNGSTRLQHAWVVTFGLR